MCTPIALAGAALSIGGAVANNIAESKAASARNNVLAAERGRQQQYEAEARAINDRSRDRYNDFQGQQDAKSASLADYFKSQNTDLPSSANATPGVDTSAEPMPLNGNNIVVQERQNQLAKAKAYGDQQATALGNLRGFGDLLGDVSRQQARDASQVGQIGGFMRGSSNVLPLELNAANRKGTGLAVFGDIMGGLGKAGVTAGLSNGIFGSPVTGSSTSGAGAVSRGLGGLY